MKPGLYPDIPELEYHGMDGLSSTGAKTILRCPAQYKWDKDHPQRKKAWDLGTVAHRLILGKGADFAVVDGNRNAKDVKAKISEEEAAGRVVLKPQQMLDAQRMAQSVRDNKDASAILENGDAEVSIFAGIEGIQLRGRVDWLTQTAAGDYVAADVKTTSVDLHSDQDIQRTMFKFGYHIQAAQYLRILDCLGLEAMWVWIFVTSSAPHCVRVVTPTDDLLRAGRKRLGPAIERYKECTRTGEWVCRCEQFTPIDLPSWA